MLPLHAPSRGSPWSLLPINKWQNNYGNVTLPVVDSREVEDWAVLQLKVKHQNANRCRSLLRKEFASPLLIHAVHMPAVCRSLVLRQLFPRRDKRVLSLGKWASRPFLFSFKNSLRNRGRARLWGHTSCLVLPVVFTMRSRVKISETCRGFTALAWDQLDTLWSLQGAFLSQCVTTIAARTWGNLSVKKYYLLLLLFTFSSEYCIVLPFIQITYIDNALMLLSSKCY